MRRRKRARKMLSDDVAVNAKMEHAEEVPASRGPCFFCLQDSLTYSNSELNEELLHNIKTEHDHDDLFTLRHISRFLKVFEDNGERGRMSEDLKRKLYNFAYHCDVFICEDCSKMMKEFKELYHLMEVTELRLKWCVQRMHHVMTEAKNEFSSFPGQVKKDVLLLKTLRTISIDRMKTKITSLPAARVILRKRKLPNQSSALPVPETETLCKAPADRNCKASSNSSHDYLSISNEFLDNSSNVEECATLCKSVSSVLVHPPPSKEVPETSKQEPKSLCSNTSHLLSMEHSSQLVSPIHDGESSAAQEHYQTKSKSSDQATCLPCPGVPLTQSHLTPSSSMKSPKLNVSNASSLEKESVANQSPTITTTTTSSSSCDPLLPEEAPEKYLKCSLCRAQFQAVSRNRTDYGPRMLHQHIVKNHCEQFFPIQEHKLDHVTVPQYRKILSQLLFKDFTSSGSESCPFCGKRYYMFSLASLNIGDRISRIKTHLVQFHFTQVKDCLMKIQRHPNLQKMLEEECTSRGKLCGCGVYLPNFDRKARHKKFHCILSEGVNKESDFPSVIPTNVLDITGNVLGKILNVRTKKRKNSFPRIPCRQKKWKNETLRSCSYCRFKSIHSSVFTTHRINFHPEHFFLDVWKEEASGVTKDQFQRILHNILFPDLFSKSSNSNSCHLCGFHCDDKPNLKRHFVRMHKNQLREQLRVILQDPGLLEKVESFQSVGMSCPCGMYIPSWKKYSKEFHEMYQCTLKADNKEMAFPIPSIAASGNHLEAAGKRKRPVNPINDDDPVISKKYKAVFAGESNLKLPQSCPYCLFHCNTEQCKGAMSRHLLRFHPQYYFPQLDYKAVGISPDQFQRVLHDIIFSELVPVAGNIMSCRFCGKKFQEKDKDNTETHFKLRRHLIRFHKTDLLDQLEVILRDPNLNRRLVKANPDGVSCPCGMYLPKGIILKEKNHHKKYQCRADVEVRKIDKEVEPEPSIETTQDNNGESSESTFQLPSSCPYCRYQCGADQTSASMIKHILRYHPQYYFPHLDPQSMGVSLDQFQRVLQDIMFSELVPVVKGIMSCRFCGKKFPGKDHSASNYKLRRHLVHFHRTEVADQLSLILRDPNLVKRLAKVNPDGESCSCGMYLPQGLSHKDNHHEKFQCNLRKFKDEEDSSVVGMEVDNNDVDSKSEADNIEIKYDVTVGTLDDLEVQEELDLSDEEEYRLNEYVSMRIYQDDNDERFMDESDPLQLE